MLDIIRRGAQSWAVKIVFGIIIVVFVFWGVGNMDRGSRGDLAEVNGEGISQEEFRVEAQRQMEVLRRSMPEISRDEEAQKAFLRSLLNGMIVSKLRQQEAKKLGLFVSDEELRAYIQGQPQFFNDKGEFDNKRYHELLRSNRIASGELEDSYRRQILEGKFQAYISMSVGVSEAEAKNYFNFGLEQRVAEYVLFPASAYKAQVTVSDGEATQYYDVNKERFRQPARMNIDYIALTPKALAAKYNVTPAEIETFYKENAASFVALPKFESRQIFIACPPEASVEEGAAEAIAKARAEIGRLYAEVQKGADFSELARKYSQDRAASVGGQWGWQNKGQMPPEIDEVAFALNKGAYSTPVRTAYGFHLILLEDKVGETTRSLDSVKDEIKEELQAEKARVAFAKVQEKAEDALRQGKGFTDIAKEFGVTVQSTGLASQEVLTEKLELHKGAAEVLKNVPVGKIAPSPLEVVDGIALVMVKESKPAEISPFAEVKSEIVNLLADGKAASLAR